MPRFRMTSALASRDVTVKRAICDGCDAARLVEEHSPEPALWVVTEGAFELRDRRARRVLDPTCAMIFQPGEPFTIRHPSGPDVCLSFRGPLIAALARSGMRLVHLDAHAHAALVSAIRQRDELAVIDALAPLDASPAPARTRDLVDALVHELRLHYSDALSLTELATSADVSVFHACREFRRATGHTIHGYRRELRLRQALSMLIDGDAPLADIAAHAGFASQSHLTNLFRARFGTTPGRVRAERSI